MVNLVLTEWMLAIPERTYSASDLRRSDVIEEATHSMIGVREAKSGVTVVMMPMALIDRQNRLDGYAVLFTRVVIESQRPDPSPAMLGEVGYIAAWSVAERAAFVRAMAEALSDALLSGEPQRVAAFIDSMRNVGRAQGPQFDRAMLDRLGAALDEHIGRPSP